MGNWQTWLKGLVAAVVGGVLGAVAQVAATGSPTTEQIRVAAISGAALTVVGYLKQSPIGGQK